MQWNAEEATHCSSTQGLSKDDSIVTPQRAVIKSHLDALIRCPLSWDGCRGPLLHWTNTTGLLLVCSLWVLPQGRKRNNKKDGWLSCRFSHPTPNSYPRTRGSKTGLLDDQVVQRNASVYPCRFALNRTEWKRSFSAIKRHRCKLVITGKEKGAVSRLHCNQAVNSGDHAVSSWTARVNIRWEETALITLHDVPFCPRSHNTNAAKSHRGSLTHPLRSLKNRDPGTEGGGQRK